MLAEALGAEVAADAEAHRAARDARGRALVVRNRHAASRDVTTGAGLLRLAAPRESDKRVVTGARQRSTSKILPPYLRKSKAITAQLPAPSRGLPTGDFREGLAAILGDDAPGFSPSAITRLTSSWQAEPAQWKTRSLADRDDVYVWADGVHVNVRLEGDRLAARVRIGVRSDGPKEVIALEDGHRESRGELARVAARREEARHAGARRRGRRWALSFWASGPRSARSTRRRRSSDLGSQDANVLDKLPKSIQARAKAKPHEMMASPTRTECARHIEELVDEDGIRVERALPPKEDTTKKETITRRGPISRRTHTQEAAA